MYYTRIVFDHAKHLFGLSFKTEQENRFALQTYLRVFYKKEGNM